MLVLPIINKGRVMNAEIKLKKATKIRKSVCYEDAKPSEIIVNREKFSESSFVNSKDVNAPIDFIRSKSLLYPRRFLVTTKEESNSNAYDVYEVPQPPKSVNKNLDKLYSKAITDMRKEIPRSPKRGRYISFEELGMDEQLSDEKIARLQRIVKDYPESEWPRLFDEAGIMELTDVIRFLNHFECTVIADTSIPEESLQDTLKAMSALNTRDYRNLKKYYRTAKGNTGIYTKMSYVNKLVNGKPLTLIQAKDRPKQLIKKKDEIDYPKAA